MTESITSPAATTPINQPITDTPTKHVDEHTTLINPTSTAAPQGPTSVPETTLLTAEMSTPNVEQAQITTSSTAPFSSHAQTSQATVAEEPQSSLTHKFLETEWTALRELRALLPDIFAKAFLENPQARDTPVTIWGITIDPSNPANDARVSVVLMKFLRARNLNSESAAEMLINTLRWRQSFDIDAALKEEYPQEIFGKLGHNYGHDKGGRPVTYNIYGGNQDLKAVFGDVQRFLRWRVAMMEKCVALLDFREIDQCLQVHDYEGVTLTSRDANSKSAASEATNIFQSHYPEMLYKKFFVNVPTILNWIFWAFKSILSSNTMAKMSVVGTGHHAIRKALLPYIDDKQLPQKYGGEADAF